MGVNTFTGGDLHITTCIHGVDLRFTPRCYMCKPWIVGEVPGAVIASTGHDERLFAVLDRIVRTLDKINAVLATAKEADHA